MARPGIAYPFALGRQVRSLNRAFSPHRSQLSAPLPTAAELDILAVLWKLGTATVREVHDELAKDDGYTTTLKADRDGYDIQAKPERNTDPKQAWLMLQTLLADRFKLALHRETRDLPVYDLMAAKSGLKLPSPKQVRCVSFLPGETPHAIPGRPTVAMSLGLSCPPQGCKWKDMRPTWQMSQGSWRWC